ncbi:MAG: hypothetical protein ACOZNI_00695 [Myxococcota bacterium]
MPNSSATAAAFMKSPGSGGAPTEALVGEDGGGRLLLTRAV